MTTPKATCSVDDCERLAGKDGWCTFHRNRWRKGIPFDRPYRCKQTLKPQCSIDGCVRPVHGQGWCSLHHGRWLAHGDPNIVIAPKDAKRKPGRVTKICPTCGSEFSIKISHAAKTTYCKRACYLAVAQSPREPQPCAGCGKLVPPESESAKWCSRACRSRHPDAQATVSAWREKNKEKRKEYDRIRHAADPVHHRATVAAWRKANPDKVSASNKAWIRANKERKEATRKAWALAHPRDPDEKRAYNAAYRVANRDRLSACMKAWAKANPDKTRAYGQKRRAYIRRVPHEPVSYRYLHERDGGKCPFCHKRINLDLLYPDPLSPSVDHIIPLSRGGDDTRANKQLTHLVCNYRKHTKALGEQLRLIG